MFYKSYLFLFLPAFVCCSDKRDPNSFFDSSRGNNFSYFSKELGKLHIQTGSASSIKEYSLFPRTRSPEKLQIRENHKAVGRKSNDPTRTDIKNLKGTPPPGFARTNFPDTSSRENFLKDARLSALSDSDVKTGSSSRVIYPITSKDNHYNRSNVGLVNSKPFTKLSKNSSSPLMSGISCQKSEKAADSSYLSRPPEAVLFGANKDAMVESNIGKLRVGAENKGKSVMSNSENSGISKNISGANRNSSIKHILSNLKKAPPKPIPPGNCVPSSSSIPEFQSTANKVEKRVRGNSEFEGVAIVSIGYKLCTCGGTDMNRRDFLPILVEICLLDREDNILYKGYVKYKDPAINSIHEGIPKECDTLGEDIEVVGRKVKDLIFGKILVSFNIGRLLTILNLEHPAYYIRDIQSLARFCDVLSNLRFQTLKGIYTNFISKVPDNEIDDSVFTRAVESSSLYLLFENQWNNEVADLMRKDSNPLRKVNAHTYAHASAPNSRGFHMEANYDSYMRHLPRNLVAVYFDVVKDRLSRATIIKLGKHIPGNRANPKYEDWSVNFLNYRSGNEFSELKRRVCEVLEFKVIVGYDVEKYIKGLCYGKKLSSEVYDLKKIFGGKEKNLMRLASKYLHVEYAGYPSGKLKAKIAFQFYSLFRFQPSTTPEYTTL